MGKQKLYVIQARNRSTHPAMPFDVLSSITLDPARCRSMPLDPPSAAVIGFQFSVFSFRFFSLAWFTATDGVGLARGCLQTPGQTENRKLKTENC
jgi:hypothetical protein